MSYAPARFSTFWVELGEGDHHLIPLYAAKKLTSCCRFAEIRKYLFETLIRYLVCIIYIWDEETTRCDTEARAGRDLGIIPLFSFIFQSSLCTKALIEQHDPSPFAGGNAEHAEIFLKRDREVHGPRLGGRDSQVRARARRPRRHAPASSGLCVFCDFLSFCFVI